MYLIDFEKSEVKEVKVLKKIPGFGWILQDGKDILELPNEDDNYRLTSDKDFAYRMLCCDWFVPQ